ncbi:tyrosine-type recombinase/integrase [Hoeflea poritis]|uniref:Tyrosine-type recombinase/integrase n=1 Tax=Hoeflea poritis TaxID=2993659 RepID=A0ABT4VV94_9HYPH|nr:site-specific integrase [Hoeflea poritis]MDA4848624.1 tyrosine-type recombinase/integrase [Hoeflea poritis]
MPKLTKRVVDALKPETSDIVHWDDELAGFGIRVRPSGRKSYIVKCRCRGRQIKMTIGTHGPITVEQARTNARTIIAEAKAGRDPSAEHSRMRKSPTIKDLGKRFLEEYVPTHCRPTTEREYRRSVELFINPKIGTRKIIDIERADIAKIHHNLRDKPYQANRTLGVLSKMFNLAEIWGLRPDGSNPCRHVKKYKEEKRERFLSDAEYKKLGEALRITEAEKSETRSAIDAIWLLMLTGCRLNEIMTLKWSYVDLDAKELRLPDSKTGPKTVHLGLAAVDLLKNIKKLEDNDFVITGKKPSSHLTDLQHPWRRIRALAKLDDVRIHDLRHSFASRGLIVGEGLPMIGKLLGHSQVQTTARYAHLANDPIKSAADRIAEGISISAAAS